MVEVTNQIVAPQEEDNMSFIDGFWFGLGVIGAILVSTFFLAFIGACIQYVEEQSDGKSKIL